MILKKLLFFSLMAVMVAVPNISPAAISKKTSKQSAIQSGTTVRSKVAATNLYDQACYEAYYGCMDQFCIPENSSGGSCACSNLYADYEQQLEDIKKVKAEAERIKKEEVERINAGAQADIIFNGTREYDELGNILYGEKPLTDAEKRAQKRESLMAIFESNMSDMEEEDAIDMLSGKTGDELFKVAEDICMEYIPENCARDVQLLRQVYSKQIASDCKGFENDIAVERKAAEDKLAEANAAVRDALSESFKQANMYNLGECTLHFKECMQEEDKCGPDWENCVLTIASENMQNNKAVSTAHTTVDTVTKYDITASTMEILNAKRNACERVLDSCMAVRNEVWPEFLRDAAPIIRLAEQNAESKLRQSCLVDISDCIQKACKDDIVGKGKDTMDACLARPDMVRSFCKIQIDSCERMEPQIWDYVQDKLAALRVDVCTQEVKDCFTADTRCGPNFENCIGMDYEYIHEMCPIDTLVVCKQTNKNFSMDDLDSMLMGLYLNIDNAALAQCQKLVDTKMAEVCGSTSDCNRFASDKTIGTGSLRSQKIGTTYRVSGMISFGSIKMGDASGTTVDNGDGIEVVLEPGQIGVQEYLHQIRSRNIVGNNDDNTIAIIEEELNNIAGTINRTIEMIEQDPQIQFCVSGRDLSQITGNGRTSPGQTRKGRQTTGRFPNLLNQLKMQIAIAALRQAQDNYNAKLTAEISEATRNASVDLAQYMCQKVAENGGQVLGSASASTPLVPPYAISYDVGSGLTLEDLTRGGTGHSNFQSSNGSGMSKDVTAVFNRENRTCHVCTTVTNQSCTVKGGNWFRKKNTSCQTETDGPKCEDIPM